MRTPHHLIPVLVSLAALGCEQLDSATNLHDLRILAVQTEPAELKLPAAYFLRPPTGGPPGMALPEWDVDVTVYAFDPRGGLVSTRIALCPEDRDDPACLAHAAAGAISDDVDPQTRAELEAVYLGAQASRATADQAVYPAAPVRDNRFRFRFTSAVVDSLIAGRTGQAMLSLAPWLPRFSVDAESLPGDGVDREIAFKRLPLSVDFNDPMLPRQTVDTLLSLSAIATCSGAPPEPFEQGPAPCFFDFGANTNPVLAGFDLVDPETEAQAREQGEEIPPVRFSDSPQLGPHPVLLVDRGAVLHLRPVFGPGAMEPYQVFVLDLNTQQTHVENRYEDFVCDWFTTAGDAPSRTTATEPGMGGGGPGGGGGGGPGGMGRDDLVSLDADWILPDASTVQPGQRDALVLVVRDQRGGVAVGQITVEYGP